MDVQLIYMALGGFAAGLGLGLVFAWWRVKDIQAVTNRIMQDKTAETEKLVANMKEAFGNLSLEALSKNTEEFLKVANESLSKQAQSSNKDLEGKKSLIDQTFKSMKTELDKVQTMVQGIEKDRKAKFDVLSKELSRAAAETKELRESTQTLKAALTNSRVRGQWGERMAEDVLRLAGFLEGTNYIKQGTITEESQQSRPDYTFYMPQGRKVHMDVKFPLENYLNFLEAANDTERDKYRQQFLKDAKNRIVEVSKRGYVNDDTLDYVLVFIPNEQVYAFINEHDHSLLDEAMKQKVILCSPITLYAILAVIRQAVDNFHLERTAGEILGLLSTFHKQWEKFVEAMDKVGRHIESSQKAFDDLTSTRRRMLEKPLNKIEELKENERFVQGPSGQNFKVIEQVGHAGHKDN